MSEPDRKKILLVDDDLDLLEQNKMLIESRGYEVITAENSEDAWKKFKEVKPDAAILDLIIEHHDSGFVLSYKIKKDKHGSTIPVFLLTSATYITGFKFEVETEEEKEWILCDGIINKPVIIDDLVQKLESFFTQKVT